MNEPPFDADDTKPRPPVKLPDDRTVVSEITPPRGIPKTVIKRAPLTTVYDDVFDDSPRAGGCASPILMLFTLGSFIILFVAIVGLSGLAGYRDGVNDASTKAASTRIAVLGTQRAAIATDQQMGNFELLLPRCQFVATLQPGDSGMVTCIQQAEIALSATPTSRPSTSTPTLSPTVGPTQVAVSNPSLAPGNSTDATLAALVTQAKEQIQLGKIENYENAVSYLEAVRTANYTYQQGTVESLLCSSYETLGTYYDQSGRLSEMVVVINRAIKMSCRFERSDWPFTVNAAQLYLDAKGYLDAGNLPSAVSVFKRLMAIAPSYQNTKALACQAFRTANDVAALANFKCN